MADGRPGILFTAFELSGDEHAAPVITQLKQLRPDLPIWALGGPRMAAAGANIIESTTEKAAMLAGAAAQALEHKRRVDRLGTWLKDHSVIALVPVDSPAANWAICALIRRLKPQAKIIHLVAPQLWAWASWRIAKMRRLTDHVLCLLPFEPAWFAARGVAATFVGHPAFENPVNPQPPADLPTSHPRLALLPGSRMGELKANWPTMLEVFRRLRERNPALTGAVAAVDARGAARILQLSGQANPGVKGVSIRTAQTPGVLAWCDAALVTSGTATLHVAVQAKPMVVIYNISRLGWLLVGQWVVRTRTFSLPNLLAQTSGGAPGVGEMRTPGHAPGRIVPEFVPHFRQVEPVLAATQRLLEDPAAAAAQRAAFVQLAAPFQQHHFAPEAAAKVLEVAGVK